MYGVVTGSELPGISRSSFILQRSRLAILDWTNGATHHCARVRRALEQAGTPIGNMDLLIASHAISEGSTLVTNNLKHFSKVPGLNLQEWK
jgi:tRNA(fMet)-specific endonuclease VapC